jgi:glycosyltransferase involved in cell wall biosynthesis
MKVSVIIPAYNASKYISKTIESVINQDYNNLEILIVDDGSIDNTKEIVEWFCKIDHRIIYLYQENRGCSAAKNTGLANATGEFIQYLDADDILSLDKISAQMSILRLTPNKVVICRTMTFSTMPELNEKMEVDTEFLFSTLDSVGFICKLYIGCAMIQPNAFLISKNIANLGGPWDEKISPSTDEDSEYFLRVMLNSDGIIFCSEGVNFYRSDRNVISLSRQITRGHVENALLGINKRAFELLLFEKSKRTLEAIMSLYSNFIYMYYDLYPDLCSSAIGEARKYGKKIPITGGVNFKRFAYFFGMIVSLKVRRFLFWLVKR